MSGSYTRYVQQQEQRVKRDGREIARLNDVRALKALHRFGFLRARDLAVLLFQKARSLKGEDFQPVPIVVDGSAWRMAQRCLARLRRNRMVVWSDAPDGSLIYSLAEAGAQLLQGLDIEAKAGEPAIRRVTLSHYHHRRLSNEIAIVAAIMGYRVNTEHEIATGRWFGGKEGFFGKEPDVVIRGGHDGRDVWLCEVERSRRRKSDAEKLLSTLQKILQASGPSARPVVLDGGHTLRKVVFVCDRAFEKKLRGELKNAGWTDDLIARWLSFSQLLYVTEGKYIRKKAQPGARAAESVSAG